MRPRINHGWDVPAQEAMAIQRRLARQVDRSWQKGPVKIVAGIDVGFEGHVGHAVVALLSFPDLEILESARADHEVSFPYVPGLLAFREGPVILAALQQLSIGADVLMFDGHGVAHPRRLGIATHLGVLLGVPSIGCAKSRLVGTHQEPGDRKGSHVWLHDEGEVVGAVLRTRENVNPVYVSIGHRIDLETAVDFVLRACTRYRLPEPTRCAHRLASGKASPAARQLSLL